MTRDTFSRRSKFRKEILWRSDRGLCLVRTDVPRGDGKNARCFYGLFFSDPGGVDIGSGGALLNPNELHDLAVLLPTLLESGRLPESVPLEKPAEAPAEPKPRLW